MKKKWKNALRIGKPISSSMRVCSHHFQASDFFPNTKFNIGITPSGLITEISASYGGRASNKHIVNESGILNKCEFNDGVMVDKGYRIESESSASACQASFLESEKADDQRRCNPHCRDCTGKSAC
ncbi:unnamed protein product [Parnassius apollo]|uniref:(apollo) hypothetical protein n=1 Tax=Parnassius apollo TaxID=110799 RepID=A0A8S3X578_PARAO|nr:unnamed protein product [Parnassius apollo]